MKIEEKISVFFTNTIQHAQRHRLTAGDILSRTEEMSGSGVSKANQAERETKHREAKELAREQHRDRKKRVFDNRGQGKASTSKKITNDSPKSSPKPTKADLGEVKPPVVMPVENPKDHMRNAFLEFNSNTEHTFDMFHSNSYPLYRATMGLARSHNILHFLRFDDSNARSQCKKEDKAAPIRDMWTMLNSNLA
ncbi:hypothetical protein EVAR_595_1 [Eumeta japonica]|uniref:Uncharacterized protein n=1 Tax=Eumeta variegata TaxID=151549 RepID=A0A4C1SDU2_EUMVA|nr:hypothetical protein EVAR_595_1 [Eumeta japonica]